MKQLLSILSIITLVFAVSCNQGKSGNSADSMRGSNVPDTGFTGTQRYKQGDNIHRTVEFKNGLKDGITRTFYKGGALEQEITYVNDKKDGPSKWYYPDGKLFRVTPYENDTINGDQIQYYKNDRKRAIISYNNGKRVPSVIEYEKDGTKITDYPNVTFRVTDNYNEKGVYKIFIEMSDLSENNLYYRGDFVNGLVDLDSLEQLKQNATTGYLDLKKAEGVSSDSVTVIAGYLTSSGNRYYRRLAIPLPYKDLK